ncbi:hypothetical protein HF086_003057 [Spodoptera exigua]|uniref:Strawberry notch AAA domain-containing protein n=1 Tax=Spodoptera exigua TaxID=7107 RepID=A0A922MPW4_SPOEX|nr:hypothetical protein HF086_003057 [Spodoptera exigua]
MVGMTGMNSYLLQNLSHIIQNGMGSPFSGMLGQLGQVAGGVAGWPQNKPGNMWQQEKMGGDEEEVDDEEMGVAETYADYMPTKCRTIAGIIFENYIKGRKRAIWVSVSNDLKYDAERDLRDIGAGKIEVHPLNKFKYAKISSAVNGNVKKGVIFSTYSALIGETQSTNTKYRTRLKQLLQWCGDDFDGVIVFDECHKAKNLCPVGSGKATKTGLTALELQNKLPKARVVYASATGASEPRNMAYMVRLGIWGDGTPFPTFMDFINAVEKRGVGAMEIVAMDMKLRGMYIARQLSFHGVSFKIEEVPLSDAFKETYDKAVALVSYILNL